MLRALALLLTISTALAQTAVPPNILGKFELDGKSATLSVSTTSARVQLPTGGIGTVFIYNSGQQRAWVTFGDASVTSPDQDLQINIGPGCGRAFATGQATYLAATTQQGTTSLVILSGHGLARLHHREAFSPLVRPPEAGCPH